MNLYFRLVWTLIRSLVLKPLSPADTLVIHRRVLPNDLDINFHMNNGRYLTIVDLSLIEFFSRTGVLKASLKHRWRPMSGGTLISFRRGLSLFQKYEVHFTWSCSSAGWNYMTYEFITNKRVHATGILKGGIVSSKGLVNTHDVLPLLPKKWHNVTEILLKRPLTTEVLAWQDAELRTFENAKKIL